MLDTEYCTQNRTIWGSIVLLTLFALPAALLM